MDQLQSTFDVILSDPKIWGSVIAVFTFIASFFIKPIKSFVIWMFQNSIKYRKNRLHTKIIRSTESKDFDVFISAYHEIFPEDERISTAEIIRWVNGKGKNADVEYFCFLGQREEKPICVAINIFSSRHCLSYFAYIGLTEEGQKWQLSRQAVKDLLKSTKRCYDRPNFILVEAEDPYETRIEKKEMAKRKARVRKFEGLATACNLDIGRIDIRYVAPAHHTDLTDRFEKGMLLLVLSNERLPRFLEKETVINMLEFLYYDVYQISFNGEKEEVRIYKEILDDQIENYKASLPKLIELMPE